MGITGAAAIIKVLFAAAIIVGSVVVSIWVLIKGSQGLVWLLSSGSKGIAFLVRHVFRFVHNTVGDIFRSIGALLTAFVLIPLTLVNFLFGRWSTGRHYGRALEDEVVSLGLGVYRVFIGNPLHFVGMGIITDGFERRLPDVVARAPGTTRSSVKDGKFDGYKVTGVLPAGGSGARLFLARPRPQKLKELLGAGNADPGQVVIKAFSLSTGSTLPQIVRESRALESARRLGLVLEHELSEKSFHYVMPFVPGDNLDKVITKMHAKNGKGGLSDQQLRVALGYVGDLLYTLDAFHSGGLWHKDIKPSNLIISEGRAHLVDLGLVTPLSSAMTLTTHGTEYFRDPEMVRQALRGVKVHEVNGVKFDIYSTGAVLYTLVENSFPAHGSLSHVTARCPEVINWIIRRAMADLDGRYDSVQDMLADVRTVLAARDPFAVRPADLPSVNGRRDWKIPRGAFPGTASTANPATSPKKGRARRLRPVLHTATAEKRHRRATGRTLVAAFVGLLFLLGLGVFGVRGVSSMPQAYVSFEDDPVEWCVENESDGVTAPVVNPLASAQLHSHTSRLTPTDRLVATPTREKPTAHSTTTHSVSLHNHESRGTPLVFEDSNSAAHFKRLMKERPENIFLLVDLPAGADRGPINDLQSELESCSFNLLGNPSDGIGDERDILFAAGARNAIGVSDIDDPEAVARLELYLRENPSLDALAWASEGQKKSSVRFRFVSTSARESIMHGSHSSR